MAEGAQSFGEIRDLLRDHGVRPRRAIGQHFLVDPNIVAKTLALADVGQGDHVVEIGAGTGTLTRAIARSGASVLAFEVDGRLRPVLDQVVGNDPNVEVRFEDASRVDFAAELRGSPWVLVANLPYNIGTPVLLDVIREVPQVSRFVVMVQREVADRLLAEPGNKDYGVPSVVVSLYTKPAGSFPVSPSVFHPRPAVDSKVVRLDRVAAGDPIDLARAVGLAQAAFGKRRKMLRRSLRDAFVDLEASLAQAGVAPTARAEELLPDDFLRLAMADVG